MVRKLSLLLGLLFFVSISRARARTPFRQSGSVRRLFLHAQRQPPRLQPERIRISGQYKFTSWLGGVADIDGHYGRRLQHAGEQLSVRPADFLSGARIAIRPASCGRSPRTGMAALAVTRPSPRRWASESTRKSPGRFTGASFRATGFTPVSSAAARTMAGFRRAL